MVDSERMARLRKTISSSGGPDKYIDDQEETQILDLGDSLGIPRDTVEAVLNHYCRDAGWTRERDILRDLTDSLDEATRDDGAIDQKEFEHCVNYAVHMNMPRKRAMELSVKYVVDRKLRIKKGFLKGDWFGPIRAQNER